MTATFDARCETLGTHAAQTVPVLALGAALPFALGLMTDSSPRDWLWLAILPPALRLLLVLAHHARARRISLPVGVGQGSVLTTAAARSPETGGGFGALWVLRDGVAFRQGNHIMRLPASEIARVEVVDPGSLAALLGVGRGEFPLVLVSSDGRSHPFSVAAPMTLARAIRSVIAR